ncbi:MAG: NAD(P)/FAD-dependent oxidoreductase, partial [Parapedobacter sp.]
MGDLSSSPDADRTRPEREDTMTETQPRRIPAPEHYDVVVAGAGFAGLYALYKARELGYRAIAFESQDGVGGVWRANRYPGAHCDVESADYSFSFDEDLQQDWKWTKRFAPQKEILAYLEHVADRYDLRSDIVFNARIEQSRFDEDEQQWIIRASDGAEVTAQFYVFAGGALSVPLIPRIPGLEKFEGELLYTSTWPTEEPDFTGKRAGVIGTGSSGVQLIPELSKQTERLLVFQRTPAFTVPAQNRELTEEEIAEIKANYAERRRIARESVNGMTWKAAGPSAIEFPEEERREVYESFWKAGANIVHSFGDLLVNE